jgi:RHS repeat-associated protein
MAIETRQAGDLAVLAALAVLALGAGAAPAAADPHPNTQGGVAIDQAFQVGDVDNINLFNGSLTVTIPLGISYPVNASLAYRFTLVANSNPWDFWSQTYYGGPNGTYQENDSAPSHCSNAGLGWRVSFGAVMFGYPFSPAGPVCATTVNLGQDLAYAIYEGPDGSQHLFYATLHPDDPDDYFNGVQDNVATGVENVLYTRDGSYLRLKRYNGYSEIEFPDGKVHRFGADGRIVEIRDPWNNSVNFAYLTTAGGGCPGALAVETSCWQITDQQLRTHWIYFRTDYPVYNGSGVYGGVINRVVLAGFNGAPAVYQFNYTLPPAFGRGCPMGDPNLGDMVVPLLKNVTLPDLSSYAPITPSTSGYLTQPAGAGNCVEGSGSLTDLILPTLGSIGWTYQTYHFPTAGTKVYYRQTNPGIQTRTTSDASGNRIGMWTYATSPAPPVNSPELVNTVTDALGNRWVRYFSVATDALVFGPGANLYDYGRPYSPLQPMSGNPTLFLSDQVFDAASNLKRSEYVRFEHDPVNIGFMTPPDAANNNGREAQRETTYDDNSQAGSTDTSFDGVGHYRQRTTDGTFAGNNVRTEFEDFNPGRNSYNVNVPANTDSGGYVYLPPTSPWVLNTADYQYAQENGVAELRSLCYDANTGHLNRRRLYVQSTTNPSAMSANDVIQEFPADPTTGNLGSEIYFGGDNSPVTPTSSALCSQVLPATPEYQINYGFIYGVNSVIQYVGTGFFSMYLGIDQSTGLPNYSRDTAGIQTSFNYDPMGRLVYVLPRDGAWTQYLYHPAASAALPATLTVEQQQNGSQGTVLAESKYTYDGLGRMIEKDILMPNGTLSAQTTTWNALNWKTAVSAQGTPYINLTQYLNYDPFGRVGTIQPPDSSAHKVTMSYQGVQTVNRTVSVGTNYNGSVVTEQPAMTTELYDRFGRLASVTEPSGSANANVTTSYLYDPGNRLTQATTTSAGTTQARLFSYDHRGFLNWETHPETAPNYLNDGHHKDYLSYDSRGHYHRTVDGSNDLSYTYDIAERPRLIYNTLYGGKCNPNPISTPTCVKQFSYDNAAAGALGRLYQASRFNHLLYGGLPYTDEWTGTYTYLGLDGRISQRSLQHTFNGQATGAQEAFTQSWTYSQLGKIDTETYPNCASTFSACGGTTPRAVESLYTNGFLTSIPGYTGGAGITYYANGMVSGVTHSTGISATYGLDPYSLPRPSSITAGGNLWSTGAYAYDGAGNVVQVGQSVSIYDLVSRLTATRVEINAVDNSNPALDTFSTQFLSYDAFGNLQMLSPNSTPTAAATNHLTGGTYDASGNLRTWNGPPPYYEVPTYDYDELNKLKHYKNGTQEWFYMYDADDERIWSFQPPTSGYSRFDRWTVRGLDGKVRRTFELYGYAWGNDWGGSNLWEDHVYRDGLLLGGWLSSGEQRHMDVDHLGSPRLVTNVAGSQTAYHAYLPYGVEATPFNQDVERMKFTGHERDLADPTSPADDLDYMHARFTNPITGRFLSVDKLGGNPHAPQSWNRYAYVHNNPLHLVDPSGKCAAPSGLQEGQVGICIDSFIAAPRIYIAGLGDDRPAASNDPTATYRTSLQMIIDPSSGAIVRQTLDAGVSKVGLTNDLSLGLKGTAGVQGGSADVGNGMHLYSLTVTGQNGWSALNTLGSITFNANFTVAANGNVAAEASTTKGYPSIEGFAYKFVDGQLVVQLIFSFQEHNPSDLNGPVDQSMNVSSNPPPP